MDTITPATTIISAILIVVVLVIAFNLRGKIKRTERGNEFMPWERDSAQGNALRIENDEEDEEYGDGTEEDEEYEEDDEDEDDGE